MTIQCEFGYIQINKAPWPWPRLMRLCGGNAWENVRNSTARQVSNMRMEQRIPYTMHTTSPWDNNKIHAIARLVMKEMTCGPMMMIYKKLKSPKRL